MNLNKNNRLSPHWPAAEVAAAEYVSQINALAIIRQLAVLIVACQRHRGACTALSEGDTSFQTTVAVLEAEIPHRIQVLIQLCGQLGDKTFSGYASEVHDHWLELMASFGSETVIENFERHSRLISALLQWLWAQVVSSAYFERPMDGNIVDSTCRDDHQLLVEIALKDVPELVETLARMRGLATHATALGYCDEEHRGRLEALTRALGAYQEKLRRKSRALQPATFMSLKPLVEILLHEHKLDHFQQTLRDEIIGKETLVLESHHVFDFATEVIDIYVRVIQSALEQFHLRLDQAGLL